MFKKMIAGKSFVEKAILTGFIITLLFMYATMINA